jgi:hypothetical protein
MFNVNWRALVKFNLPVFLRKQENEDYLSAIMKPLINAYQNFLQYRREVLFRLNYTGQTESLENLLNDLYDPILRRIFIVNFQEIKQPLLYNRQEFLPTMVIHNRWQAGTYPFGARVSHNGIVWSALQQTTQTPGIGSHWDQLERSLVVINRQEVITANFDFIIHVPNDINLNTDAAAALVNQYVYNSFTFNFF